MADIQEVIKRLTYLFSSQGEDTVAGALAKVNVEGLKLSQSNLSLDQSFNNLEKRYVSTVAQQQNFQKIQNQVNAVLEQNPALQERANVVLAAAAQRYGQVAIAAELANKAQLAQVNSASSINARLGIGATPISADRGADIAAYGSELDRLRAKYNPLFAAQQQYRSTLTEINMANKIGAINEIERANAIQKTKDAFAQQVPTLRLASGLTQEASVWSKRLSDATSGLSGQLIAMSAGAGPVGVFLAALGPWGIAAAIGLVALEKGFDAVVGAATRMGELSRMLRDNAQTIGVNTDQLQALNILAASVGVTTDKNTVAFERFTVQLNELRKGTGTLYTQLLAVNRPLVEQLAGTRDVTSAIDLLAKAYANATDQVQKNAIARAAFGRQGFDEGRVLTAINAAGGIEAYRAGLNATDILTQNQINHWALLSVEIEHATSLAKNNLSSIFTSQMLEGEKRFADIFLDISRAAKELNDTDVGGKFFANIGSAIVNAVPGMMLMLRLYELGSKYAPAPVAKPSLANESGNPYDSGGGLSGAKSAGNISAAFEASQYKALVSALGSAASAAEHLRDKQLSLRAELAAGTITKQIFDRAFAGYGVEFSTTAINARIGALGTMATATEFARQAELKINAENLKGANINDTQAAIIARAAVVQSNAAKLSEVSTYGAANAQQIYSQKLDELNVVYSKGKMSAGQYADALGIIGRQSKETAQNLEIMKSTLPGMSRMIFDWGDSLKQLDQLGTQSFGNLNNSMLDWQTGVKSGSDAIKDFEKQFLRSLLSMMNQMLILMPIAQAMKSLLGGGGFSLLSFLGFGGGGGGGGMDTKVAKGGVFDQGRMIHPYALGGIFSDIVTRPTMFPMANGAGLMGEAGPEAIMPLSRGSDGRLGVSANGSGGGAGNINVVINEAPAGSNPAVKKSMDAQGNVNIEVTFKRMIEDHVNALASDRGSSFNRTLRRTVGTNPASTIG